MQVKGHNLQICCEATKL